MAGQIRNIRVGTDTDGADATSLGTVLETNADGALVADPLFSGSSVAGIVLAAGLAPIGAPAQGAVAPVLVGPNGSTGQNSPAVFFSGTYLNGIVLSDPATQNPAKVRATAYVTNNTADHNGDAIYGAPGSYWILTNRGTIVSAAPYSDGIHLTSGGSVANGVSVSRPGLIAGQGNGVDISGGSGTVTNFGTIDSGVGYPFSGIVISGGSGTVCNFGTIESGEYGIKLTAGGTVTNGQGGFIQGDYPAAVALWGNGTVTNFGTIYGTYWDGVELGAGGNVINYGTIYGPHAAVEYLGTLAGTVTNAGTIIGGSSGWAVRFGGGDDLLVADPGAVFIGKVDGGGNSTLELAAGAGMGTLPGLGTSFVNFASVVFDPGAAWTVTLDDPAAFSGTISGFASGDIIDLIGRAVTNVTYSSGVLTVLNGDATVATLNLAGLGGPETGIAAPGPPENAPPSSATDAPDAAIALFGQFIAAGFHVAADSSGLGTDITYQPQQTASLLAAPLHH
jgi:hypothetical protein